MKGRLLSSLCLLVGLGVMLGSCLNDNAITPYQQLQKDIQKIESYLAANPPGPNDVVVRDAYSGLRMVITERGSGEIPPTPYNVIQVAYAGRLLSNGAQFDADDSYTFTLTDTDAGGSDVIDGWKYALAMLTEGSRATVYLPSAIAYGTNGSGSIPGNAVLVFDLELKVVNTDDEQPRLKNDSTALSVYAEENSIANIQVHPSGLHYVIETQGTGSRPDLYDQVRIRYTARVFGSQIPFAQGVEQGPVNIFSSRVVNYIHGLAIGLQQMNEGGKATFYIPSTLGYGPSVSASIPANSNLVFEVELLEVYPNTQ